MVLVSMCSLPRARFRADTVIHDSISYVCKFCAPDKCVPTELAEPLPVADTGSKSMDPLIFFCGC